MLKTKIRKLGSGDRNYVIHSFVSALRQSWTKRYLSGVDRDDKNKLYSAWANRYIKGILATPSTCVAILTPDFDDDEILGYVVYDAGSRLLHFVNVKALYFRQGHAMALVRHALKDAGWTDCPHVFAPVMTRRGAPFARKVEERTGLKIVYV